MIKKNPRSANHEQKIKRLISGEVSFSPASRALYSTAACMYKIIPEGVVYPKTSADVQAVLAYAREHNLSVTARGAGSSLVGQAVNKGIILDFSRSMNQIYAYDPQTETVRVQPGIIYGELNRWLRKYDRFFPPDPSSGEYCTVGGMVANNAAGPHSLQNGSTVDYIESLEVVLHSGRIIRTSSRPDGSASLEAFFKQETEHSRLASKIYKILQQNKESIKRFTPDVPKNASGYRLEKVLHGGLFNLGKLFCGSEGTLGIITEMTLRVKKPHRKKNLTIINFDRLQDAAAAIEPILQLQPSAVEMMEKKAMELVRRLRADLRDFYPPEIESQLYVEFKGGSDEEMNRSLEQLIRFLKKTFPAGMTYKTTNSETEQADLWKIRKASFPLVYQQKRPEKVPAFIEDYVVKPRHIDRFISFLYGIYEKYDTEAIILGHAGNGNFHARPYIDFSRASDLEKMQKISQEVTAEVLKLGGAISGEHGDGRARAHLLIEQAGPLYKVYEQVKHLLDPEGILNPDVKITRENQLTKNLRFHPAYERRPEDLLLHFKDDDYYYEIEKCHGCSACHQSNFTMAMCPVFQINGEELASPRGKADILQNLIAGDLTTESIADGDYKKMLDYCIYCEACFVECPSHVDVGRLLLEHKARYRARHGAGITQRALEYSESLSKIQSWMAPLVNPALRLKAVRILMEKTVGIDRRRPLPEAEAIWRFRSANKAQRVEEPIDKVVLFHDLYARYNNAKLTSLALKVLKSLNVTAVTIPLGSAAMPAIVYGNLELARKTIKKSASALAAHAAKGYKIISTEPTAVLALRKEWPDVLPSPEVKTIAANTYEFFEYVLRLISEKNIRLNFKTVEQTFGYHAPCHLKALQIGRPGVTLLRRIPGIKINEIDRGCCGIAGTYGFKKGTNGYEQSMKIGAALFEELKKPEHERGLSECSTCRMQMEHGAQKETVHPLEILAEALGV